MTRRREQRDAYKQVGTAIRRGGDILLTGKFTEADFRVWTYIVGEVGSWSRLEEKVYRDDIAEAVGRDARTVSRSLSKMDKAGAITWTPGRRHKASKVAIHPTWEHLVKYREEILREALSETPEGSQGDTPCPTENQDAEPSAGHSDDLSGTSEASQQDTQMSHPYEESEETEEGDAPAWARFMANANDPNSDEFAEVFHALEAEHGTDLATDVLDRINSRYRWASQFRKATARQIPAAIAERNARRAAAPPCGRCSGSNWYLPDGSDAAEPCDHSTSDTERRTA